MAKILGGSAKLKPRFISVPLWQDENGKDIALKVYPPKLGVLERLEAAIPMPEAPQTGVQRDDRGKVLKDTNGKPLVHRNEDDPSYLQARSKRAQLIGLGLLLDALRDQVVPETPRSDHGNEASYLEAVAAELEKAGLDGGRIKALSLALVQVQSPDFQQAEAEEAREALGAAGN